MATQARTARRIKAGIHDPKNSRGRSYRSQTLAPAPVAVAEVSPVVRTETVFHATSADHVVLFEIGEYLGSAYRKALAERIRAEKTVLNNAAALRRLREDYRNGTPLSGVVGKAWGKRLGSAVNDQIRLARTAQARDLSQLEQSIAVISRRLDAYANPSLVRLKKDGTPFKGEGAYKKGDHLGKRRRLARLLIDRDRVASDIASGHVRVTVGGTRLLRLRDSIGEPGSNYTDLDQWRLAWKASRLFLEAFGESASPWANPLIAVDLNGQVSMALPKGLEGLANVPGRKAIHIFEGKAVFPSWNRDVWEHQVTPGIRVASKGAQAGLLVESPASGPVQYRFEYDAEKSRWYLHAIIASPSGADEPPAIDDPVVFARSGNVLGVDVNADHLAMHVIDKYGTPIGHPKHVSVPDRRTLKERSASAASMKGIRLAALAETIRYAKEHGCVAIAIEDLSFEVSRETTGQRRGKKGRALRARVANIPTALVQTFLPRMAWRAAGIRVLVVDPAYTSKVGGTSWKAAVRPLDGVATRHDGASIAIARRSQGRRIHQRTQQTLIAGTAVAA